MTYFYIHVYISTISLKEKMENKKVAATEDENEVDDWDIYKEVIGGPSHGRILGLGGGYSTKDVYPSDDQDCNKRICLEREEEHEKLKEEVKDLKSVLYELKDLVQSMRENNSNTYARSRQSASMVNSFLLISIFCSLLNIVFVIFILKRFMSY